jgi:alpha-methylacyl-CoA racemase
MSMSGPLQGYKVVELAGIGPGPFAAMMLADMGAEVLRVDRRSEVQAQPDGTARFSPTNRGRRSVGVDLKHPQGRETVLTLAKSADALIEGFRPGVTERLGLGPDECLALNPRLVYGRMTGWGQQGPYAQMAGHDINYIALSGALSLVGPKGEPPVPPVNLVGDFGGGGLILAYGIVCALLERGRSGAGQVVDAAMTDGSALLGAMFWGLRASGTWLERGTNLLDGGAPFYDTYETADGAYISLGSIEPQFYAEMIRPTGLADDVDGGPLHPQMDRATWPETKERVAAIVRTRTRAEWCEILEGTDVCFAPVLTMDEAPLELHNVQRGTFVELAGVVQPAPAPRFSRTPGGVDLPPPAPGEHTDAALLDWGFKPEAVAALRKAGAIA